MAAGMYVRQVNKAVPMQVRDGTGETRLRPSIHFYGVEMIWAEQEKCRAEQNKSKSNADKSRAVNQLEVSYIRILSEISHLSLSKWRGRGRSSCSTTPVF